MEYPIAKDLDDFITRTRAGEKVWCPIELVVPKEVLYSGHLIDSPTDLIKKYAVLPPDFN